MENWTEFESVLTGAVLTGIILSVGGFIYVVYTRLRYGSQG